MANKKNKKFQTGNRVTSTGPVISGRAVGSGRYEELNPNNLPPVTAQSQDTIIDEMLRFDGCSNNPDPSATYGVTHECSSCCYVQRNKVKCRQDWYHASGHNGLAGFCTNKKGMLSSGRECPNYTSQYGNNPLTETECPVGDTIGDYEDGETYTVGCNTPGYCNSGDFSVGDISYCSSAIDIQCGDGTPGSGDTSSECGQSVCSSSEGGCTGAFDVGCGCDHPNTSPDCADKCPGDSGYPTTHDVCGVCNGSGCQDGNNNSVSCGTSQGDYCDCDGGIIDDCGICGGQNSCVDCDGVPNGGKVNDECGVCGGSCNPDTTGCDDGFGGNYCDCFQNYELGCGCGVTPTMCGTDNCAAKNAQGCCDGETKDDCDNCGGSTFIGTTSAALDGTLGSPCTPENADTPCSVDAVTSTSFVWTLDCKGNCTCQGTDCSHTFDNCGNCSPKTSNNRDGCDCITEAGIADNAFIESDYYEGTWPDKDCCCCEKRSNEANSDYNVDSEPDYIMDCVDTCVGNNYDCAGVCDGDAVKNVCGVCQAPNPVVCSSYGMPTDLWIGTTDWDPNNLYNGEPCDCHGNTCDKCGRCGGSGDCLNFCDGTFTCEDITNIVHCPVPGICEMGVKVNPNITIPGDPQRGGRADDPWGWWVIPEGDAGSATWRGFEEGFVDTQGETTECNIGYNTSFSELGEKCGANTSTAWIAIPHSITGTAYGNSVANSVYHGVDVEDWRNWVDTYVEDGLCSSGNPSGNCCQTEEECLVIPVATWGGHTAVKTGCGDAGFLTAYGDTGTNNSLARGTICDMLQEFAGSSWATVRYSCTKRASNPNSKYGGADMWVDHAVPYVDGYGCPNKKPAQGEPGDWIYHDDAGPCSNKLGSLDCNAWLRPWQDKGEKIGCADPLYIGSPIYKPICMFDEQSSHGPGTNCIHIHDDACCPGTNTTTGLKDYDPVFGQCYLQFSCFGGEQNCSKFASPSSCDSHYIQQNPFMDCTWKDMIPTGAFDPSDPDCVKGDLNGDGGYNVLDVVALANTILGGQCFCAADINSDGGCNVLDIVGLTNCILSGNCPFATNSGVGPGGESYHEPAGLIPGTSDAILTSFVNGDLNMSELWGLMCGGAPTGSWEIGGFCTNFQPGDDLDSILSNYGPSYSDGTWFKRTDDGRLRPTVLGPTSQGGDGVIFKKAGSKPRPLDPKQKPGNFEFSGESFPGQELDRTNVNNCIGDPGPDEVCSSCCHKGRRCQEGCEDIQCRQDWVNRTDYGSSALYTFCQNNGGIFTLDESCYPNDGTGTMTNITPWAENWCPVTSFTEECSDCNCDNNDCGGYTVGCSHGDISYENTTFDWHNTESCPWESEYSIPFVDWDPSTWDFDWDMDIDDFDPSWGEDTIEEEDTIEVEEDPFDCTGIPATGDLNNDGSINILDVQILAGCVLNSDCSEYEFCSGDMNGDGVLGVMDIIVLTNQVLNNQALTGGSSGKYTPPAGMTQQEQNRILKDVLNAGKDINRINDILGNVKQPTMRGRNNIRKPVVSKRGRNNIRKPVVSDRMVGSPRINKPQSTVVRAQSSDCGRFIEEIKRDFDLNRSNINNCTGSPGAGQVCSSCCHTTRCSSGCGCSIDCRQDWTNADGSGNTALTNFCNSKDGIINAGEPCFVGTSTQTLTTWAYDGLPETNPDGSPLSNSWCPVTARTDILSHCDPDGWINECNGDENSCGNFLYGCNDSNANNYDSSWNDPYGCSSYEWHNSFVCTYTDADGDDIYDYEDDCVGEYDECGICNGPGILDGECDCNGNVEDCAGICGGTTVIDNCGVCGGPDECDCGNNTESCECCDFVDADGDGVHDSVDDCIHPDGLVYCEHETSACGCADTYQCVPTAGQDNTLGYCCGVIGGYHRFYNSCDNTCGSISHGTQEDDCGVCGGNNACHDCFGVPNGDAVIDCAGVCGGNSAIDGCNQCVEDVDEFGGSADCVQDCQGVWGGVLEFDECGVCGGQGPEQFHDCDGNCIVNVDCQGVCGGNANYDCAGECAGGNRCGCTNSECTNYWDNANYDDGTCNNCCFCANNPITGGPTGIGGAYTNCPYPHTYGGNVEYTDCPTGPSDCPPNYGWVGNTSCGPYPVNGCIWVGSSGAQLTGCNTCVALGINSCPPGTYCAGNGNCTPYDPDPPDGGGGGGGTGRMDKDQMGQKWGPGKLGDEDNIGQYQKGGRTIPKKYPHGGAFDGGYCTAEEGSPSAWFTDCSQLSHSDCAAEGNCIWLPPSSLPQRPQRLRPTRGSRMAGGGRTTNSNQCPPGYSLGADGSCNMG